MDYCEFISNIEKDPEAIVSDLTVRDYLLLRMHIRECSKCYESAERVNEKYQNKTNTITLFTEN